LLFPEDAWLSMKISLACPQRISTSHSPPTPGRLLEEGGQAVVNINFLRTRPSCGRACPPPDCDSKRLIVMSVSDLHPIETAPVIILVLDAQGRIVRFNPFMAELTGYRLVLFSEMRGILA
jgi:hypothetical protein